MVAILGWLFLAVTVLLAWVSFWEHGLFFSRFSLYLAIYAISYPLYIAGNARWYWFTPLTDAALLLATNEAIDLRLEILSQEERTRRVRLAAWWFGVLCCCFVVIKGVSQWNVPQSLQMVLELTLAFCVGRILIVALYVFLEQIPCHRYSARHLVLLLLFLIPSLTQMAIRFDNQSYAELYWITRSLQMSIRIGVMLAWLQMFWSRYSAAAKPSIQDPQVSA